MKIKDVYIVAKYSAHPRKKAATVVPGYMKDPANVSWTEELLVSYGLKTKDLLSAKIVLNINKRKVERNSFQNGKTFEELFDYFYSENKKEIDVRLRQFGITVSGEVNEPVQQDVPNEKEEGAGSESADTAEPVQSREGDPLDEGTTGTTRNHVSEDASGS